MRVGRIQIYLTIVCLCAGYLITFSYTFTQEQDEKGIESIQRWYQEDQMRETLIEVSQDNSQLELHLRDLQQKVNEKEEELSSAQTEISLVHKELEAYRLLSGLSQAQGPGITITLEDSAYASDAQNPNDYIVHEQDVRRVVNELFAAGAEGLSINGQRFIHTSSIRCVGPTIIVNGVKSAAPFQIIAIGESTTLSQALLLPGGVIDVLKSWGISVKLEQNNELMIPAYLGEF
jgi:uncharacterized protein YlxW (UPF0749 family)